MPMSKREPEACRRRQGHSPNKQFRAQLTRHLRCHYKILTQVEGKVRLKGPCRITFVFLFDFNILRDHFGEWKLLQRTHRSDQC
jgi:hypothetical protein